MKKRILSVLLVVAMLASMVVLPVYADSTATQSATTTEATNAKTICPCCGKLYTEIEWTEVTDVADVTDEAAGTVKDSYAISTAGHYRLMNDISGENTINIADIEDANVDKFVFDLNGWTINGTSRGFYSAVDKSTPAARDELYVVDSVGTGKVAVKAGYKMGGCFFYSCDFNVNIYGGTWTTETGSTSGNSGSLKSSTRTMYLRNSNATFYGGTFDMSQESLPAKGFFGVNSGYSAVITVNGGTFIGGEMYTDTCGDFNVAAGCTMVINGGDIQGKVYGAEGTSISVSGNPQISNLDLTAVGTVTVGELTEGASIGVTTAAKDTAFTNAGIAAYAEYFYGRYRTAYAMADGALALDDAVCPHCDKAYSEITWLPYEDQGFVPGAKYSTDGSTTGFLTTGHYYLSGDLSIGTQFYLGISETGDLDLIEAGTLDPIDFCLDTRGYDINPGSKRLVYSYPGHSFAVVNSAIDDSAVTTSNTSTGAGVYLCNEADAQFHDVDIINTNTTVSKIQGAGTILVNSNATLEMTNATIDGIQANRGSAIYGSTGSKINLTNCVVKGDGTAAPSSGTTYNYGGAIAFLGEKLTLQGCTVIGGASKLGGAIYCKGSEATITDSTIEGSTTTSNGATLALYSATVSIKNSTVEGGTSGAFGGVAFLDSDSEITIEGSTVYSGSGEVPSTGVNTDGVYGSGPINIKNSTVEDISTTKKTGTGVVLEGEVNGNFHIAYAAVADISAMTDGNIVVYAGSGAFTAALADDTAASAYLDNFTSGVSNMNVKVKDAALVLEAGVIERYCPHCGQTQVFKPYIHDGEEAAGDITEGGHYYLSEIVYTGSEVGVGLGDDESTPELETLPIDVVLDLNGEELTCGNRVFTVRTGCSFYLMDSVGGAVVTGGSTSNTGSCISALSDSKLTLHSGTYTQYERAEGSYTKNGGVIIASGAELIIENNAVVTGGTTTAHGGNIYAGNGSTITIKDNAQVIGGSAQNGGNIYATSEDTTVNISGDAVVSGGTAQNGGNMYLPGGAVLNMTGGTVSDGIAKIDNEALSAKGRGGNIYLGAAEHTISGGTISGGVSQADDPATELGGGNIYVYSGGKLTVSGGTTITGGTSLSNGGNIFTLGALVLEDAAISGGTAANSGADVYIGDTGSIEIALAVTGDLGIGIHDDKYEGTAPYGKKILDSVYNGTDMNSNLKLTLDGVRGNAPIVAQENALWVQDGGVAVVDIDGNYEYFADPADAFDVYDIDSDSWLMVCGADEIVLTENAWIDVNGCDFTVSGAYTASFIDTSNDDYETFGWVTLNGATLGNGNSEDANSTTYYTVEGDDGRYSFHLLDMEITAVSLKTRTGGLYYYAKWYCDDTMKGQIETFGIATQLGSMPTDLTADTVLYSYMSGTELVSGVEQVGATMNNIISTTPIEGYTNDQRGAMKVYAAPYVCLKSGDDVIGTTEVGMSLKDCCDSIDAMITDLLAGDSDDQVKAQEYISYMNDYLFGEAWKDMGLTWTFTNFKQAESTEA